MWALALPLELTLLYLGQRRLFWLGYSLLGSRSLASLLAMPGTVLHELSHWLMALVLGVRVGKVELFRPRWSRQGQTEQVQLGVVQHQQTDWLRSKLIAVAPVLLAPSLLGLIDWLLLGSLEPAGALAGWLASPWPVLLLWPWLAFSCAAASFPSPGDDIGPWSGGLLAALALALLWWLGGGSPSALLTALGALGQLLALPAGICALVLLLARR